MTDESRAFSAKEREKLAGGAAMKDGSFPIKTRQDLLNAVRALGRAKNPAAAKRHIIKRARALNLVSALPKDWDVAHEQIDCVDEACTRHFLTEKAMLDHAQAVHTFEDIRSLVSTAIRAAYGREGQYGPNQPRVSSIYTYVMDIADDWVVFEREGDANTPSGMFRASYSITDGTVTLGAPVQVVRRTVYDAVKDGIALTANTVSA